MRAHDHAINHHHYRRLARGTLQQLDRMQAHFADATARLAYLEAQVKQLVAANVTGEKVTVLVPPYRCERVRRP